MNSTEQTTKIRNINLVPVLITSWNITKWFSINQLWKELMECISEHTGLISSYQLLITAACTRWKAATRVHLTGAYLYLDKPVSGYLFDVYSGDMK